METSGMILRPSRDGIDHVNVYSKGRTRLGKMLTNFYKHDTLTDDGWFKSIEGYWYWLLTPEDHAQRESLRQVSDYRAKEIGRTMATADWGDTPEFRRKIRNAIWNKIASCPEIQSLMVLHSLPYTHYYVYGRGATAKVVEPEGCEWILRFIEKCGAFLKTEPVIRTVLNGTIVE